MRVAVLTAAAPVRVARTDSFSWRVTGCGASFRMSMRCRSGRSSLAFLHPFRTAGGLFAPRMFSDSSTFLNISFTFPIQQFEINTSWYPKSTQYGNPEISEVPKLSAGANVLTRSIIYESPRESRGRRSGTSTQAEQYSGFQTVIFCVGFPY